MTYIISEQQKKLLERQGVKFLLREDIKGRVKDALNDLEWNWRVNKEALGLFGEIMLKSAVVSGILILGALGFAKGYNQHELAKLNKIEPNAQFRAKIISVTPRDNFFILNLKSENGAEFSTAIRELELDELDGRFITVDKSKLDFH